MTGRMTDAMAQLGIDVIAPHADVRARWRFE